MREFVLFQSSRELRRFARIDFNTSPTVDIEFCGRATCLAREQLQSHARCKCNSWPSCKLICKFLHDA